MFDVNCLKLSVYLKQAVNEDRARVDHGKLVHELHLVLQRHVKHPRPEPDHQKENVRNEKSENKSKSISYSDMKNLKNNSKLVFFIRH